MKPVCPHCGSDQIDMTAVVIWIETAPDDGYWRLAPGGEADDTATCLNDDCGHDDVDWVWSSEEES